MTAYEGLTALQAAATTRVAAGDKRPPRWPGAALCLRLHPPPDTAPSTSLRGQYPADLQLALTEDLGFNMPSARATAQLDMLPPAIRGTPPPRACPDPG